MVTETSDLLSMCRVRLCMRQETHNSKGLDMQSKVTTPRKPNSPGRPFGKAQRKPIDLPDGDKLVPFYTTFAESTGLNAKYFQRNRHRFPLVTHAGIIYVKDRAGRQVLAEPKKTRRARR